MRVKNCKQQTVNCELFTYIWCMLLKRAVTFLLTLLILFADSGQTIYAHTCLKTKHTHISIGQPKHCCSDTKAEGNCVIKKSSCCEVSSKYLKQDFINQQTEVKEVMATVAVLPVSEIFISSPVKVIALNQTNTSPPIVFSKSENIFTQTFRI